MTKFALHRWVIHEHVNISRFRRWYTEQHETNPDEFPMEMEPGDWDRQYQIWEGPAQ